MTRTRRTTSKTSNALVEPKVGIVNRDGQECLQILVPLDAEPQYVSDKGTKYLASIKCYSLQDVNPEAFEGLGYFELKVGQKGKNKSTQRPRGFAV